MPMPRTHDWVALRDEWVALNLKDSAPGSLSIMAFARDKGINYSHMRTWAARDRWKDRLTRALSERSESTVLAVQESTGVDEAAVRHRHATTMRFLAARALQALRLKSDDDWKRMSLAELVKVLQHTAVAEREALGLPDKHEFVLPVGGAGGKGFEPIGDKIRRHEELVAMGDDFLRYVELRRRREEKRRALPGVVVEPDPPRNRPF